MNKNQLAQKHKKFIPWPPVINEYLSPKEPNSSHFVTKTDVKQKRPIKSLEFGDIRKAGERVALCLMPQY